MLIRPVILPEANEESLEWLTLWEPKPDAPEPVAGDSGSSSSADGQLRPVPSQEEMRKSFRADVVHIAGAEAPKTKRQLRARRAHLRDYGRRVFTEDSTKVCGVKDT